MDKETQDLDVLTSFDYLRDGQQEGDHCEWVDVEVMRVEGDVAIVVYDGDEGTVGCSVALDAIKEGKVAQRVLDQAIVLTLWASMIDVAGVRSRFARAQLELGIISAKDVTSNYHRLRKAFMLAFEPEIARVLRAARGHK